MKCLEFEAYPYGRGKVVDKEIKIRIGVDKKSSPKAAFV